MVVSREVLIRCGDALRDPFPPLVENIVLFSSKSDLQYNGDSFGWLMLYETEVAGCLMCFMLQVSGRS